MITIEKEFDASPIQIEQYDSERILFFDIETTGLSAKTSFLYLIGCCYYQDHSWKMVQWFSEGPADEAQVLTTFFTKINEFDVLLHFNGSTFDMPYLLTKCNALNLNYTFDSIRSIDLYKIVSKLKSILHLNSCTQKSVERYMGLIREDQYSGGDLIKVYANYLGIARTEQLKANNIEGNKDNRALRDINSMTGNDVTSKELLQLLLLHNEEDVKGLRSICCFTSFEALINGSYTIDELRLNNENYICFTLLLPNALPKSFNTELSSFLLSGEGNLCTLKVPLYEGTLKHYLTPYQDYFYLPLEDTVIHKSISASVDKKYRRKATADQCFIKKTNLFLPQLTTLAEPIFQLQRKDKLSFFECTDERLSDMSFLHAYTLHLIQYIMKGKKQF